MGQRNFPAPICADCLACNEASTIHCDHLVCLALHIVRFHGTAVTVVTNDLTDQPDNQTGAANVYDLNGDGGIDAYEASLRDMANSIYSWFNQAGNS